jgi:hypothetical protein
MTLGGLGVIWCFFSLDVVIDALTVMIILVQFIGQSIGLLVFRYGILTPETDDAEAWKVPLFPLPVVLQVVVMAFIFITSDNCTHTHTHIHTSLPSLPFHTHTHTHTHTGLISGNDPLLDLCVLFILLGCGMFLLRQKKHKVCVFSAFPYYCSTCILWLLFTSYSQPILLLHVWPVHAAFSHRCSLVTSPLLFLEIIEDPCPSYSLSALIARPVPPQ